jgi:hypothetical protein
VGKVSYFVETANLVEHSFTLLECGTAGFAIDDIIVLQSVVVPATAAPWNHFPASQ